LILPIASIAPTGASLPLLVFFAEMGVVTLSTIRTIFITRGWKALASLLGFFEVSIWLFAISQVMQNLTNPGCSLAFAGGFSLGNFLGILIEKKLALGNVFVQVTTENNASDLIESLRSANYGVTSLDARGASGPVQVVFTVIERRELQNVVSIVKGFDPKVFYSVNDLQTVEEGIFPAAGRKRNERLTSVASHYPQPDSNRCLLAENQTS
jgi:uncharacterized protein YebE (UPF0316 family)